MNAFNNHNNVTAPPPTAFRKTVITALVAELQQAGTVIEILYAAMSLSQQIHAMLAAQDRGLNAEHLTRNRVSESIVATAQLHLHSEAVLDAYSADLVERLSCVAGQHTIKAPDIDIEAAEHIKELAKEIKRLTELQRTATSQHLAA
jgi:hypothetical protein